MRHLALSLAIALSVPAAAAADIVPLPEISEYLNDIDSAQSTFTPDQRGRDRDDGAVLHPASGGARGSNMTTTTCW